MLQVESYVGVSKVHGLGLFSTQKIKKGESVWSYHSFTTQVFSKEQFIALCNQLSLAALREMVHYSYIKNKSVYYLNDNAKFINHGQESNIAFVNDHLEIATRDIEKGEEFIEDYTLSYDANDFFFLQMKPDLSKEEILEVFKRRFLSTKA